MNKYSLLPILIFALIEQLRALHVHIHHVTAVLASFDHDGIASFVDFHLAEAAIVFDTVIILLRLVIVILVHHGSDLLFKVIGGNLLLLGVLTIL